MVKSKGPRNEAQGNLGGDLVGIHNKLDQEGYAIRDDIGSIMGSQMRVWIF